MIKYLCILYYITEYLYYIYIFPIIFNLWSKKFSRFHFENFLEKYLSKFLNNEKKKWFINISIKN